MHHRQRSKTNDTGFTLFEILIAIFIFGVVVATVFGSYTAVISDSQVIEGGIARIEMASNCLNRIETDLASLYVIQQPGYSRPGFDSPQDPYRVVAETVGVAEGSFGRLRFTSQAHVAFGGDPRGGIAQIVYYIHQNRNDELILKRSDMLPPYAEVDGNVADPILCEAVKTFELAFLDENGDEHDAWDSESKDYKYATPRAVKIKLETGDDSVSIFLETMIGLPIFRDALD